MVHFFSRKDNWIKTPLFLTGGFTLIECLVVISIIGISSTILALNYRTGDEQLKLQRATHKLAQDIRKAQEMAMSTKDLPAQTIIQYVKTGMEFRWKNPRCSCDRRIYSEDCPSSFSAQPSDPPICYDQYRYFFSRRSLRYEKKEGTKAWPASSGYGVYLTKSGDNSYLIYTDTNNDEKYTTPEEKIESIRFEPGVSIESLSIENLSINFKPPQPKTKITDGTGTEENEAIITLKANKGKKVIKVNKAGLIYVE